MDRIRQAEADAHSTIEWHDADWVVVTRSLDIFMPGGILWGFPYQRIFDIDSIAGNVPTHRVQEMFDFLRARFGLRLVNY